MRFKISVLALLILAFILIVYSGSLFFTFRLELYREIDEDLAIKARKINSALVSYLNVLGNDKESVEFSIQRVVSQTGSHPHKNKIEKLENLWVGQMAALNMSKDYVEFLNARAEPIARSSNLSAYALGNSLKKAVIGLRGKPVFTNSKLGNKELRTIIFPVSNIKDKNYVIVIGMSRKRIVNMLRQRLLVKSVSIFLILILAAFLSHLYSRRVLKPVEAIIKAARDINYKDLSLRIQTTNVDIEMKALVDALNEMIARLETSFKYIGQFSSHVSHELKTPLAILRGESELALKGEHSSEEYRRVISDNLEEIARMAKIIEDLLLLTKLDYEPQVFNFKPLDLVEFFSEMEESGRILTIEKNINFTMNLPKAPMMIQADKVHLRRLFYNLITNAVKFTPPGGQITVHLERQQKQAVTSVKDSGVGISKENISKIFNQFFHFEGSGPQSPTPGNGLGLSIALSIARVHQGLIDVQSQPGKGSTFIVRLPLL